VPDCASSPNPAINALLCIAWTAGTVFELVFLSASFDSNRSRARLRICEPTSQQDLALIIIMAKNEYESLEAATRAFPQIG
jgi:hypothetical protein